MTSYRDVPVYHPEHQKRGIFYFLTAWLFITINMMLVKMLTNKVPISVILLFMNGISTLLFLPFMFKQGLTFFKTPHTLLIIARSLAGFLCFACMLVASRHIPLVDAVLLSNTGPLFIPFIVLLWYKTPINHKLWWSIGVGFIGVIFILKPGYGLLDLWSLIGLSSGFLFALAMVIVRTLATRANAYTILFYYFLFSTLFSVPYALIYWETPPLQYLPLICGIGVIFVLNQWFLFKSLQYGKTAHLGPFSYIAVVYAAFFDWLFWNQTPGLFTIIGVILVTLGSILTIIHTRKE